MSLSDKSIEQSISGAGDVISTWSRDSEKIGNSKMN